MRMMIDIPEQLISEIDDENYQSIISWFDTSLYCAIENGIPLEQIRDEIERLHYHPKLDFIKNDEVVEMALDIIDKYRTESEDKE